MKFQEKLLLRFTDLYLFKSEMQLRFAAPVIWQLVFQRTTAATAENSK
jgi:hypothetical protein